MPDKNPFNSGNGLRQRAEAKALETTSSPTEGVEQLSLEETHKMLHELQVHQLELEMQNEELRRTQIELESARAQYFDLYNLAPVGYCTVSEKGFILEANLTAATLLDVSRAAMVGQAMSRFILAEDQDTYYRLRKRLLETGTVQVSALRLLRTNSPPFWARLEATVTSGEGASGAPLLRLMLSDITERKQWKEEQKGLQLQLAQVRKMESIGRLAGGVAHDFNNMLGVILGHTELAQAGLDPSQPLHAHLEEIRKAAERSALLTSQLLAFARKQIIDARVIDLNTTVAGMLVMMRRLISENIEFSWTPGTNLWSIKIDPSQIDQILANLCINSRDAITDAGKIMVETKNRVFDAASCSAYPGCIPGEYVALIVSDNGCGMDEQALTQIFEPFFTTKETGKGTGLGLAMIYGIVKQNNGFIYASSHPGQGTTFSIYLPRHQGKDEQIQGEELVQADYATGNETILLVEDQVPLLEVTALMLEHSGYTVLAATTPDQAIELAKEHAGKIRLLMTDVIMPEMNGQDLARQLHSLYPGLKRLFMSGYTADIIGRHGVLDDSIHFIQKPFSMRNLSLKVREVLEQQ